jgi:SAM-dependent methyltransferase
MDPTATAVVAAADHSIAGSRRAAAIDVRNDKASCSMSTSDKPPQQDPAQPEFWDQRYRNRVTPWDAGGVPDALRAFVAAYARARRVLVPGCGSGWEVRFLAENGWDVVAVDFSAAAIEKARANLGQWSHVLVHGDYFAFDAGDAYDVVYERTFLCALPRRMWPDYAARTAQLLKPGGLLAGFFYFSDEPKGPPFGTNPQQLAATLGPFFTREHDRAVDDSIALFHGRERWQQWRRHQG